MKAVLDTNVFISFLLGRGLQSPPSKVVLAGIHADFTIVCSHQLLAELKRKVADKPYLSAKIPPSELDLLVGALVAQAEFVTADLAMPSQLSRDRNDDFLLIAAVIAGADYLVTGDKDLLVLGEFEGVRIVSPADFAELLDR